MIKTLTTQFLVIFLLFTWTYSFSQNLTISDASLKPSGTWLDGYITQNEINRENRRQNIE